MAPARPFNKWWLAGPHRSSGWVDLTDSATPEFLWRNIERLAAIPDRGRDLFPGTLAQKNSLLRDFRNCVRQGRLYDNAAALVAGNSSALLSYYSLLNLAKAELLISDPHRIQGQVIRHGLSFDVGSRGTLRSHSLQVYDGVFSLLYKRRMNRTLDPGTRLSIRRMLQTVPEVGWELDVSELGPSSARGLLLAIVFDASHIWNLIAVQAPSALIDKSVTAKHVRQSYSVVDMPHNWRDVFAISRRYEGVTPTFFQETIPVVQQAGPPGTLQLSDIVSARFRAWNQLYPYVDESTQESYDALICPSLFKSREMPMPASLARYALMFYVSSLVRYRPSELDPSTKAEQSWLLDAFVSQARGPLLQTALSGIVGKTHFFRAPNAFRL